MPIAEPYTLSAVTVGASELSIVSGTTTLQSVTDDGYYELYLDDRGNMAKGDEFIVRVKEKAIAGATQKTFFSTTLSDVQSEPFCFPGRLLMHGWDMTLQKLAGTDRAFDASIRKVS